MAPTKSRRKIGILLVALFAAMVITSPTTEAQLGSLTQPEQAAQAKSQEEFDIYLAIVTQTDPREIIRQVDTLASRFPKSQLLGVAYEYQMHAFQQVGDFDNMFAAGQKALLANPGNLNTLLTLAPAMANIATQQRTDRTQLLAQAEAYAKEALEGIDKVRLPHQTSLERWEQEKSTMQSSAHETLGVIAMDRGNPSSAIHELETAILLEPMPNGAQFFRLGVAYAAAGQREDAEKNLRRASELGPDRVRTLALKQIEALTNKHAVPE